MTIKTRAARWSSSGSCTSLPTSPKTPRRTIGGIWLTKPGTPCSSLNRLASSRSSLSWVRPRLVEADASLHEAQVLLLTPQRGYALWKRQIDDAWENTSTLYQSLREKQTAVQGAQNTFTKTLTVLTFLIPCLEAKTDPELQQDWLDAARSAQEVALLLDPPQEREMSSAQIDMQITKLSSEAEKLEGQMQESAVPVRAGRVAKTGGRLPVRHRGP